MIHKATPITQKSKSSPLKISEALIEGTKQAHDTFTDYREIIKDVVEDTEEKETDKPTT